MVFTATRQIYAWPNDDMGGAGGGSLQRVIWLGALATVLLYLALLPGPLYAVFPSLPGRRLFTSARRALGVSAAVLAGLHGYHGFVDWGGGIEGLRYWGVDYNVSLLLGGLAWMLLLPLVATSFDAALRAMGERWQRLHRAVYAAAVLVVAHAMMVTIHILDLQSVLWAGFVAIEFLLVLEALRLRRGGSPARFLVAGLTVASAALYWSFFLIGHHRH